MSDRAATLSEVINRAVENGSRALFTCIPAKIVKWDAAKQRANCQILIKQVTESEEGEREVASWPVVPGVPVQFPGAGGFRVTFPISDGGGGKAATTGTLFFSHRSLDKWLTGDGKEVDPEFDHDHALTDAIFMPGLMPFGAAWGSCPDDSMSIGDDSSGAGRIHIKSGEINLGENAQEPVLTKKDAQSLYFAINAAACVANDGGAAFKAALLTGLATAGWTTGTTDAQLGSRTTKSVR
jgi:hypothetical protein